MGGIGRSPTRYHCATETEEDCGNFWEFLEAGDIYCREIVRGRLESFDRGGALLERCDWGGRGVGRGRRGLGGAGRGKVGQDRTGRYFTLRCVTLPVWELGLGGKKERESSYIHSIKRLDISQSCMHMICPTHHP